MPTYTDRDSMLERWANGAETLAQHYEDLYGPPPDPPTLPAITTRDGLLEAIVDATVRAKRNINKISPTYHNTDSAYVKTVPSGDVHYASLEQIGGKTLVWNQLMYDGQFTDVTNWTANASPSTFTFSTVNNVLKVTRDSGSANLLLINAVNRQTSIATHKYYMSADISGDVSRSVRLYAGSGYTNVATDTTLANYSTIVTASNAGAIGIQVVNTQLAINGYIETKNFFVTDLTLLCGAGNEPTTVDQFKTQFPALYYAFTLGTLLSADVTSVVSKDAEDTTIDTYTIPADIQALTGYGWSAGSVYNYIDFERKVFVQNVGFVDLSALTFGYGPSVGWSATLPNVKNPADDDTAFNGLSATLKVTDRNTQAAAFDGGTDAGMVSVAGGKVYVGTGSISIIPSGTLIYELDTPVETDISAYLADDGLIEVEAGGTLTFPNSNGDDYRIPVPSTETFWVE